MSSTNIAPEGEIDNNDDQCSTDREEEKQKEALYTLEEFLSTGM